ncbi:MAG: hypothetical protein JST64_11770, partial [Actinobacteria bacterium]|nr:hypothetical protein [Actinomycetota bacterium]
MTNTVDVLSWGPTALDWDQGRVIQVSRTDPIGAAGTIEAHVADTTATWLLLWDPALGAPDPDVVAELCAGRADAWHSGLLEGLGGQPEEHDYIHPIWPLALDADPDIDSVSWRLSLGALLVRTEVLRVLGGIDRAFQGRTGAGLELGRRLIERGAVIEHTPRLAPRTLIT